MSCHRVLSTSQVILDSGIDRVSNMYTDDISIVCFGLALIYTLGSRLTGVDPIPYIEVVAIVCGLVSLGKKSKIEAVESRPLTKSGIEHSIRQQVIGIALWCILKFGALKSIIRQSQPNVKYRTVGDHHYAEVSVDDGSRQAQIYVPLLRGRYQLRISGSPFRGRGDNPSRSEGPSVEGGTDIPYTTFYSNGYTWSIPVKPEMIGYNRLEFELSESDNGVRRFEVAGPRLADLQDLIGQYQAQVAATNAVSGLAEAYD